MAGIDDAIVSITFDNSKFEQRVSETIRSLDKLRNNLNFSSSKPFANLQRSADGFNLNVMTRGISAIASKFTALGVVGFTAIQKITGAAISFGKKIAKEVLDPIFSGGKNRSENIEQAKFMFRGLGMDVESAMKSALDAVRGTAYGLDEAAKAAATFGASGIKSGADMTSSLRGVAGAAAMTGVSFGEMAQIYQSSAGTGIVNNQDLGQFATRGLNAAAAIAKVMGKTEAQIHEMASQGKLDFKTFAGAMDEAFGEHATKANETYSGSLANVKAAMSRLGASFFTPHLEQQRDLFNALSPVIDNVGKALMPLINMIIALKNIGIQNMISKLKNIDLSNFKIAMPNIAVGLYHIVGNVIRFIRVIREAFTDIFPKSETSALVRFSEVFRQVTEAILLGGKTAESVKSIFRGVFSVFSIGIEIVKNIVKVFYDLFSAITNSSALGGGSNILSFFADLGESLVRLKTNLVDKGGIAAFFKNISDAIKDPAAAFEKLKASIELLKLAIKELWKDGPIPDLFINIQKFFDDPKQVISAWTARWEKFYDSLTPGKSSGGIKGVGEALTGVNAKFATLQPRFDKFQKMWTDFLDRTKPLRNVIDKLGEAFSNLGGRLEHIKSGFKEVSGFFKSFEKIGEGPRKVLSKLWEYIMKFFGNLGESMKHEMKTGDFEGALDILNVGLLGGIAVMFKKFFKSGFSDLGGGIVEKVNGMFDQLTGTLKAMQTELKAKALMEIAIAMGVLTISIVLLSMISSADLTKSLLAIAVGFGLLVAVMLILDTAMTGFAAVKFVILSVGMALLGVSMIFLATAMKSIAELTWGEIIKGLVGVGVGIKLLVEGMNNITSDTMGLIKASFALIVISIGLRIMANAMQAFATMSWSDLAKGLIAVVILLKVLVATLNGISSDTMGLIKASFAMILISVSLRIMANAMQAFATMSWEDIAKGLLAVGVALGMVVYLTNTMPKAGLVGIGAGLILVSIALNIMAKTIAFMGGMSIETLAKGLIALGLAMLILVVGTNAMKTAMGGALAILVVAVALTAITAAIATLGNMKISQVVLGLVALAAIFAILGLAAYLLSPVIVPLLLLGVALGIMGIAMAAFGFGAYQLIAAFALLGETGEKAMDTLFKMIAMFVARAPLIGIAIARVLVSASTDLAEAAPTLIKALKVILIELLDAVIELAPKLGEAVTVLIRVILEVLKVTYPKLITILLQIITDAIIALTAAVPGYIAALIVFFITLFTGLSYALGFLIPTLVIGMSESFMNGFIDGLDKMIPGVGDKIREIIDKIINWFKEFLGIKSPSTVMATIGGFLIEGLINGIKATFGLLKILIIDLPIKIIGWLGDLGLLLLKAGKAILSGLWDGIKFIWNEVIPWLGGLPGKILSALGDLLKILFNAGKNIITGLWDGIKFIWNDVIPWIMKIPGKILAGLGILLTLLFNLGGTIITGLLDGIKFIWTSVIPWFMEIRGKILSALGDLLKLLFNVGKDIISGLWDGIKFIWNDVIPWIMEIPGKIISGIGDLLKTLFNIGKDLITGLWNGMKEIFGNIIGWVKDLPKNLLDSIIAAGGFVTKLVGIGKDLIQGLWDGMVEKFKNAIVGGIDWLIGLLPTAVKKFLDIDSPSKVFAKIGRQVIDGLLVGITDTAPSIKKSMYLVGENVKTGWNESLDLMNLSLPEVKNVTPMTNSIQKAFSAISAIVPDIEDITPVIAPVLDLSKVKLGAQDIDRIMAQSSIGANVSVGRARSLANDSNSQNGSENDVVQPVSQEIKFEQNIYSPKALSVNDIYRSTRSQFALAKEELNIA